MARENHDWLTAFVQHSEWAEAPDYMYFWVGVATIAASLKRQVWIDMGNHIVRPNLYTLLVAPPGVVAKSTTADLGMRLLKQVEGVHFGPATLTWQALYDAFTEVGEEFEVNGQVHLQYPLVINSSEFGITLNPKDTEMIDQLVHCWDGHELSKRTRKDGKLVISEPCLNMIACTTPSWISENVPQYLIGGGLTSRMLFVYAEKKARYVAYPQLEIPPDYKEKQASLVRDLRQITTLKGEFTLTPDAFAWGKAWYEHFHRVESKQIDATLLGGYIARKQVLTHKIAMCLAISRGDSLVIDMPLLERAVKLISKLEEHMPMVYSKIGMTAGANAAQQILAYLERFQGKTEFINVYKYMHKLYPDAEEFRRIMQGMIDAGMITYNELDRTVTKL